MGPEQFLELAERLASDPASGPAALRSAVSRSYYAAFHETLAVQRELGGRRIASHDVIGDRFLTSTDPELRAIGTRYTELKQERHRADYDLRLATFDGVESRVTVQSLVGEARALITDVRSLRSGPLRAAAQQAVRDDDKRRFG